MNVDVVLLPSQFTPANLKDRVVVVFDVLRATTTMTAALAAGVQEIRIFPDTQSARAASKKTRGSLLCGEKRCLKPTGFHLGNSPAAFNAKHSGKTLLMSTTNGTRAILAARGAKKILIGALVNASALALRLQQIGLDCTLLCAGTDGRIAMEDLIGAGAILVHQHFQPQSDAALLAKDAFLANCTDLPAALRLTEGGKNVIQAGLEKDIDYAARLNRLNVVGVVEDGDPIKVVRDSARR